MAKSKFNIGDLIVDSLKLGDGDIKSFLGDSLLYPLAKSIEDAVVTCASATYNGSNQTAQDITVVLSGVTLVENTDYIVTNNTGGTNVGSYNVTVTGIGDYENTASGTFTINKVTPTVVSPVPNVLTYNGSAQELVTAGSTNFGTLKYKVGSDSWSTSIPTRTRGGSYTVYYKVVGDSNINDILEDTVACSINEKPVTAVVTVSPSTYTYNGSYCEPTVTAKDGETVIDPSEYTVTYSNSLNAGTATVTIYDVVGGDYYVTGSTTFTINKADTTYTAPTANNRTYDATSKALLNAGSVTGGTIQYSSDNSTWSTTIPTGTNANTYTTYWRIVGDSNHNDKASASISTTISAKAVSSPTITLSQESYTYANTAFQPTPTVKDGTTTIDSGEYTVSYSDNTNVGTATCTITDKTGGNYTVSGSKTFTITCASCTAPTAKSLIYNGNSQALVNAGSTPYGTMVYSTDNLSWSTSIPSGTNAASYTVYWKVTGNTNVCCTASSSVACSIAKADSSLSFAVTEMTVEVGETKTNTVTVNAGDGTVTYTSSNTTAITVDNNGVVSGVSFGDAVITANISQTNNYNSASTNYTASCKNAIVAKYNVTDTSNPTKISYKSQYYDGTSGFSAIEIDGVVQPSVVSAYTFSTTGEHTVKYFLNDPTSVGPYAFGYCNDLTSIDIPDSVTSIGYSAFMYCSGLTSIDIPSSVTSIGSWAFKNCSSLTSVTIPNSVTSIGSGAFEGCSGLTSIDIPDSVKSIGSGVFYYCTSLTSINIPSGVTSIGDAAFMHCSGLTSIDIPNSVTSIGERAFTNGTSLTSVTIGSGVTSIGSGAFQNCSSLTSITSRRSTASNIGITTFYNVKTSGTLYVPSGSDYSQWMSKSDYYLGYYNWTKVEQ